MRIAITSQDDHGLDGIVAQHFGRCPYYTLVNVEDDGTQCGTIQNTTVVANPHYNNHQPGEVPAFIKAQGVDVLITGGMGHRAIAFFEQYGIQAFTGAAGTVRAALEAALNNALSGAMPCAGHDGEHGAHHGH